LHLPLAIFNFNPDGDVDRDAGVAATFTLHQRSYGTKARAGFFQRNGLEQN